MSKDKYGINMKKYCQDHEAEITKIIENNEVTEDTLNLHREKIALVQHERLVHLIVTFLVAILVLFLMGIALLRPEIGILPLILFFVALILVAFYLYHYFFLENTLQRWYKILDTLREAVSNK